MTADLTAYAKVLFDLGLDESYVKEGFEELLASEPLLEALDNPCVTKNEKHRVIDKLFEGKLAAFLKLMCDNDKAYGFKSVFDEYNSLLLKSKNGIEATMTCYDKPDDERIEKIKDKIRATYNKDIVKLNIKEDKSILGGFVLDVGDEEYDKSIANVFREIKNKFAWR